MAIHLDGSPPKSLDVDVLVKVDSLQRAGHDFKSRAVRVVGASTRCVCVLQSECCSVPWSHGGIVGSPDATTCVIAFIVSDFGVNVAHFDESNSTNLSYLSSAIKNISSDAVITLHLVGGYDDENSTGMQVTSNVLVFFDTLPNVVNLETFICGSINTCQKECNGMTFPAPIYQSACMDLVDREVCAAEFESKGPAIEIRRCRVMSGGSPANLYDSSKGTICLFPWKFSLPPYSLHFFAQMCTLDDAQLLQNTSTSPLVEGPTYADEMRSCLTFLQSKPNTTAMFPNGELHFRWDGAAWVEDTTVGAQGRVLAGAVSSS